MRSAVTLCGPMTVSLHFILTVFGVGDSLRHLKSFTRNVTHFIIEDRRAILSDRLLRDLHVRRVLGRILNVLRVAGGTLGRRGLRLTLGMFDGSGLLSRVGTTTPTILAGCLRARPSGFLAYLRLNAIVHGLRHTKSRVAGVTRRVIFFVSTGILGRHSGMSKRFLKGRGARWGTILICAFTAFMCVVEPVGVVLGGGLPGGARGSGGVLCNVIFCLTNLGGNSVFTSLS